MIETSRRSLITGLVALVAAPAIVKVASLMPVNAALQPSGHPYLSINEITREAVRLFENSNMFIREAVRDYEFYNGSQWSDAEMQQFRERGGQKVGEVLRIRLPNDYIVSDSNRFTHWDDAAAYAMTSQGMQPLPELAPQIPTALGVAALAIAAAPVVEQVLQKPVTRRFWSK